MKKLAILVLAVLALTGCDPSGSEDAYPIVPDGLKDCKFFVMSKGGPNSTIRVARCPNSVTTTNYTVQEGKTTAHKAAVVIDGVEYVKSNK